VRAFSEPVESERTTAANAALDVIERLARDVIEAGGRAALEHRLAKVLST